MKLRSIKFARQLVNKKVLVRVDFNVPIKKGQILDDSRIKVALPVINYLRKQKAKIVLISHLGDPRAMDLHGQNRGHVWTKFSLWPVYKHLKSCAISYKLQAKSLKFVDDCLGEKVKEKIDKMKSGEIILLENLRFYSGEKSNDPKFAKQLASLADIYVNEAFSVCHRAHASVSAITKFLPSYAGFLLEKEIRILSEVLERPKRPFIVVIGGAKISTKIGTIKNLVKKADKILIGGALANNFLKAKGIEIGDSIYEKKMMSMTKSLLKNKNLILPIDVKVKLRTKNQKLKVQIKNIKIAELNEFIRNSFKFVIGRRAGHEMSMFKILDIGPETIKIFSKYLKSAKMIIWNGPMGYTEEKTFAKGTEKIIRAIMANRKARIVIGGGETISLLKKKKNNVFISSGGGAMLEFLTGKMLPGIKPLLY